MLKTVYGPLVPDVHARQRAKMNLTSGRGVPYSVLYFLQFRS